MTSFNGPPATTTNNLDEQFCCDAPHPDFVVKQKRVANRIFRVLHPLIHQDAITTIIDLGCGTGEILSCLHSLIKTEMAAENKNESIRMVGVDKDEHQIAKAKTVSQGLLSFQVLNVESFDDLLSGTTKPIQDWSKTCIICTGNTFPLFRWKWKSVSQHSLNKPFPKYILLDFSDTSDHVLYDKLLARLGYVQEEEFFYGSGYGAMIGRFYVHQCRFAQIVNKAYFEAVDNLIRRLFTDDIMNYIRRVSNGVTAAIILPFDSYFTFARYSDLQRFQIGIRISEPGDTDLKKDAIVTKEELQLINEKIKIGNGTLAKGIDIEIPKYELLLEAARYREEYTFLPGPSLYACLLSKGSVANVVPVSAHREFSQIGLAKHKIAKKLEQENKYLESCMMDIKIFEDKQSLFFLLPFYLGTLPLFCIIIDFGGQFPVEITKQDVYSEISISINNLLQEELSTDRIESFLREFSCLATFRLAQFAEKGTERTLLEQLLKQAKEKPWKSWLHIVPTWRVEKSAIVKKEESNLQSRWVSAMQHAKADAIQKGSLWLHEGEEHFFDKNAHDKPLSDHIKLVQDMLSGIGLFAEHKSNPISQEAINGQLTSLMGQVPDECKNYFIGHCTSEKLAPELRWLVKNLLDIVEGVPPAYTLPSENEIAELSKALKKLAKSKTNPCSPAAMVAFIKTKSVFCRTQANKGDNYRFSPLRLCCFFEMYNGNLSFDPYHESHSNIKFTDTETIFLDPLELYNFRKCIVRNDQSDMLRNFCKYVSDLKFRIEMIVVSYKYNDNDDIFKFTICIKYSKALKMEAGADWGKLTQWFEDACGNDIFSKYDKLNSEFNGIRLSFRIHLPLVNKSGPQIDSGAFGEWIFDDDFPYKAEII